MSSQDKTAVQPVGGKTADKVFRGVAYACGILILVVLAAVFLFLFFRAWPLIGGDQAANSQTVSSFTGGKASSFWGYVLPLLFGTVLVSLLALLIAFFVSIGIALFISHYAPKKLATALSYVVDLLAAIPSVIYGLWGGLILVPAIYPFWNWVANHLGFIPLFEGPAANPPRTVATVAVVLAVMILPIITSMSRDIFMQTPRLHEEAALALGATKWEMIRLAVLPFGKSGIVSASMLALGRALGETMAVYRIMARAPPADNPQDFVARGQEQQSGAPLARNLIVDQDFLELLAPNRKFDEIARLPLTEHERLSLEDVRVQVEPAGAVR